MRLSPKRKNTCTTPGDVWYTGIHWNLHGTDYVDIGNAIYAAYLVAGKTTGCDSRF